MAIIRKITYFFYVWVNIFLGYGLLIALYSPAIIDHWRDYAIFIILGILAEWLVIPLPNGNLSVGFSLVLATFLLFDLNATAWISAISMLISNILLNKEKGSLKLILFNSAQYVTATFLGGTLYTIAGGAIAGNKLTVNNGLPIAAFIGAYFIVNHILVILFVLPIIKKHSVSAWQTSFKLDLYTYLLSAPIGLLMVLAYHQVGQIGAFLLFFTVLVLSFLLRLFVKLEIQNKELDVLYQVAKNLGQSLDLKKTLFHVLQETKRAINYHTGVIYLWHEEQEKLTPASVISPHKRNLREVEYKLGEGLVGKVAEYMKPAFVTDTRMDQELRSTQGITQLLRSVMAVPLIVDNKINGVMIIGKKEADGFTEKHLQLLTVLGGLAAIAMANASLYKQISEMAIYDSLTNLYNHRFFYQKVADEFERSQRYKTNFSLIMIDIDDFKSFNDTYGHLLGDKVLEVVACKLKENTRNVDVVSRYGGEEFCILLPETDNKQTLIVAKRIKQSIASFAMYFKDIELGVTVSVGVATYPQDSKDLTKLVDIADQAMYYSKKTGKNRVTNWKDINESEIFN